MRTHEKHCTLNPQRECRVCKYGKLKPAPLAHIVAQVLAAPLVFKDGSDGDQWAASVMDLADGCPACSLAAIRQAERTDYAFNDKGEQLSREPLPFDYKAHMQKFWARMHAEDPRDMY